MSKSIVMGVFQCCLFLCFQNSVQFISGECISFDTSVTQKIEYEGFHRELRWLIENSLVSTTQWDVTGCKMSLRLHINNGMFVNPDEVAELNRTGKLLVHIDGEVDVEAPAHEATEHTVYIYLNTSSPERISVNLPFHLRYQRGQITGGYGKVSLNKPNLLVWCPESLHKICEKSVKVEAPCDQTGHEICFWKNHSYQALFDEAELFIPVGNLDDYPLVSIVTLMLGCAGCIYILSVLSTTGL